MDRPQGKRKASSQRKSRRQNAQARSEEDYMRFAIREAERAAREGEVPVGAVLVKGGKIIARAHNRSIHRSDAGAHAEMLVLRRAGRKLGNYRLKGCTLYATIEPCAMCAGAMVVARIERVIFGARDPKAGAAGSVLSVVGNPRLNHRPEVVFGVLERDCARLLRSFFRSARKRARSRA